MQAEDAARYARQIALPGFGVAGQERLAAARVVVVGAGGLGCALLPVLVAAGVGEVVVVDDDVVEVSNLHRQTLYGPADAGRSKAEVAAERLAGRGPAVSAMAVRVDGGSAPGLAAGATVVVDATDDVDARYALDDAAAAAGVPLVWGSAVGTTGQAGVAAVGGPRWRDLFPVRPRADEVAVCAVAGVLPTLCTTVGGLMATEVLKLLAGLGVPLAGRLLVVDAAAATVREIAYGAADESGDDRTAARTERSMADIEEISPEATEQLLAEDPRVQLVDVREPWEAEVAALPGSTLIPLGELASRVGELDPERPVVAYCHAGVRSQRGAGVLQEAGFSVRSMAGGIDAWSRTVDPSVPRY